jgi:hypothetical protein
MLGKRTGMVGKIGKKRTLTGSIWGRLSTEANRNIGTISGRAYEHDLTTTTA